MRDKGISAPFDRLFFELLPAGDDIFALRESR
jgi:hypothetical protein